MSLGFLRRVWVVRSLMVGVVLCLCAFPCRAQEPPEKPLRPQTLEDVRRSLAAEERKAADLARRVTQTRGTLEDTRRKLVALGHGVGESETRLQEIDVRIAALSQQESALRAHLDADEGALSDLVLALERLRRAPPESVILRPGAPLEQARSAMILRSVVPDIRKRAEVLRYDLENLARIRSDLETNRALAAAENARLESQYGQLNVLLKDREALYGQTRQAHKDQTRTLAQISERARSLADLLDRLNREEKERRKRLETQRIAAAKAPPVAKADSPLPEAGAGRIPVSGRLKIRYGEKNDMGARSEGVTIEGRAGGIVVAPMGGIVRYAGQFKRFGNIVIIEHQKGLHSLLAGLGKIDTVVGRSVSAGEPVGFLSVSSDGGSMPLYYELRKNGQPMDPSARLSGLG
jgi:septal ring factor EnvC (AmiA/AmiB activator)